MKDSPLALFNHVEEETERNADIGPNGETLEDLWDRGQRRDYHQAARLLAQAPRTLWAGEPVSVGSRQPAG